MRTIQSPGVEIKEIDLSLRPTLPVGTSVFVAGFADKGPTEEAIRVTSLSEFEQIYGVPVTPAERYFYHSVTPLFNSPANVTVYRLPYGTNKGETAGNYYSALAYPVVAFSTTSLSGLPSSSLNTDDVTYIFGKPYHIDLTLSQYEDIKKNNFTWTNTILPIASADYGYDTSTGKLTAFNANKPDSFSNIGNAGIIVLNKAQTSVNNKYEGFYAGIIDNTNLNPATDFDGVLDTFTVTTTSTGTVNYTQLPTSRLNFPLSAITDNNTSTFGQEDDSVSEVLENLSPFNIGISEYNDVLSFGLFKLRQSVFSPDVIKLDYNLTESYVGSLDYHRQVQSQTGGTPVSYFLGSEEDDSPNIEILVNENISRINGKTWLDINGLPKNRVRMSSKKYSNFTFTGTTSSNWITGGSEYTKWAAISGDVTSSYTTSVDGLSTFVYNFTQITGELGRADSLFTVGTYAQETNKKEIGSIPAKLDRMFELVEDPDLFNIDITVDAGLTTIHANVQALDTEYFDDTTVITNIEGFYKSNILEISKDAEDYRNEWKTVYDRFALFAEKRRKDHLFITDLPRNIFIQGKNFETLDDKNKNFSLNMLKPIEAFTTLLNTSYATTYAAWSKVYDKVVDGQVWVPFSGTAATNMANTDANFQPWFAPAGFTRGLVAGVNDIALYPKQKQRDQLYKISVNPVAFFPGDGFTIFGQKTLQAKPSAFDRINVRRLFLFLEKATKATMKYFVFEPNTLLTRTRVINTLTPIFELAKNTEGVYDYLIVCDERNNTPDIIDQNELVVDIYLKPVRAAEFILVNFYATRTGTDFNELVS
jgi:hypothetical protein